MPIFAACRSILTLTGLVQSDTPSKARRNVDKYVNCSWLNETAGVLDEKKNCTHANFTEYGLDILLITSSFPFELLADWNQDTGTLKLVVTGYNVETDAIAFSFQLKNLAKGRIPHGERWDG